MILERRNDYTFRLDNSWESRPEKNDKVETNWNTSFLINQRWALMQQSQNSSLWGTLIWTVGGIPSVSEEVHSLFLWRWPHRVWMENQGPFLFVERSFLQIRSKEQRERNKAEIEHIWVLPKEHDSKQDHLVLFCHEVVSDSFGAPQTVACQALLSMKFSSQEHWSGLLFSSPGDLANQGSNSHLLLDGWILYHWAT